MTVKNASVVLLVLLMAAAGMTFSTATSQAQPRVLPEEGRDRFGRTAHQIWQEEALSELDQILPDAVVESRGYADMWVDRSEKDLRLMVGTTNVQEADEALRDWEIGIEIVVVERRFSKEDLEGNQRAIDESLDLLDTEERVSFGGAYFSTYTDPMNDRLVVEVANGASEADLSRALAAEGVGRMVHVERTGRAPLKVGDQGEACTQHALGRGCDDPLRGGVLLARPGQNAWCTSGFTFYKVADPTIEFITTSGHCSGSSWNDNITTRKTSAYLWYSIGNRRQAKDDGAVDAMIIKLNGQMNTGITVANGFSENYAVTGKINKGQMPLNVIMRRGGKYSDGEGPLVSKSASKSGNSQLGRVRDAPACPGDSGGPWVYNNKAVGSHNTSDDTEFCPGPFFEDAYFTFVSKILTWRKNAGIEIAIKKFP